MHFEGPWWPKRETWAQQEGDANMASPSVSTDVFVWGKRRMDNGCNCLGRNRGGASMETEDNHMGHVMYT
jgi:hypothetical protein